MKVKIIDLENISELDKFEKEINDFLETIKLDYNIYSITHHVYGNNFAFQTAIIYYLDKI